VKKMAKPSKEQIMAARAAVEAELAAIVEADAGRWASSTAIRSGAEHGTGRATAEEVAAAIAYLAVPEHFTRQIRRERLEAAVRSWQHADGEARFARDRREER
jgi:hypothetical protein